MKNLSKLKTILVSALFVMLLSVTQTTAVFAQEAPPELPDIDFGDDDSGSDDTPPSLIVDDDNPPEPVVVPPPVITPVQPPPALPQSGPGLAAYPLLAGLTYAGRKLLEKLGK